MAAPKTNPLRRTIPPKRPREAAEAEEMVVAVPAVAAAVVKIKVASAAAAKAMRATAVAVVKCILKKGQWWMNPRPTNYDGENLL